MAHWRLTPEEIRKISEADLELMEFSYFVLERRQNETLGSIIGTNLGSTWFVDSLLQDDSSDGEFKVKKEEFKWNLRKPDLKIHMPLSLVCSQNDKFMDHLKKEARKIRDLYSEKGHTSSIINLPDSELLKDSEVVDLSYVSKQEFLKFAGRLK